MDIRETDAFKRADRAVRAALERGERWRWRLAFETADYTKAGEAMERVEAMNRHLFEGEPPPLCDLSWTISPCRRGVFNEVLFTGDDKTAAAARSAAMGSAVPKTGHLTRVKAVD